MMDLFKKKQSDTPKRRRVEHDFDSPSSTDIFKRNRTLTGSTSNRFGSINTRTDLESPRSHVRSLSIQRRKVIAILSIVVLSIILIWTLVSNFVATVSVSVSDSSISTPVDKLKYEKVIQDYFGMNPLSRLSFVIDEESLTTYVSDILPEVSNISQRDMISVGKFNFSVTMRTPVAGWQINDKQYYVDSKGMLFEKNYFPKPVVQIIDNSGISTEELGITAIASNRFLSFVGRVVHLASKNGYTVTQAALPLNTTRELEIRIKEGDYLIKLSIDRSAGEQVEDMVSAIRYFTSHNQKPDYIDVRVSGKAFYK